MPAAAEHAIWRKNIARDSVAELRKAASQVRVNEKNLRLGRLQGCWRGYRGTSCTGGEHAHGGHASLHTHRGDRPVLEAFLPPQFHSSTPSFAPQFRFKRPVMERQLGRGDGDPQEIRPTDSVENH